MNNDRNIKVECAKHFLLIAFILAIISAVIETFIYHNYDTHRNSALYNFMTRVIISLFVVLPMFGTHLFVMKSFQEWFTKINKIKLAIVEIISGFGVLFILILNKIVSWGFHDGMGIFGIIYLFLLAYIFYYLLFLVFRLIMKTDI